MKTYRLLLILASVGIGIVLCVALFYAWTDWSGARQLQSALTMLEARKESVRFEDFLPKPIPDERNVAAAPIFKDFFNQFRLKKTTQNTRLAKLEMP